MEVAVGSELGLLQKQQSDAYLTESIAPGVMLFGIADGFGSLGRGTPTASLALATVRDFLRRRQRLGAFASRMTSPSSLRSLLLSALDHANARLFSQSGSHEDFVGSGTSLTTVLVVGHHAFVGHVGDARAYLLRMGRLESLTADDAMFTDSGVPSAKTSVPAKPRMRGLLWRSLGTQAKLEASIAHVELLAGDQLLLCTDGVHRCIGGEELCEALVASDSADEVVMRLAAMTKARGGIDNGTLVVGRDLLVASLPASARRVGFERRLRTAIAIGLLAMFALGVGLFALRYPFSDARPPAPVNTGGH